jgi:hypothetical protein
MFLTFVTLLQLTLARLRSPILRDRANINQNRTMEQSVWKLQFLVCYTLDLCLPVDTMPRNTKHVTMLKQHPLTLYLVHAQLNAKCLALP